MSLRRDSGRVPRMFGRGGVSLTQPSFAVLQNSDKWAAFVVGALAVLDGCGPSAGGPSLAEDWRADAAAQARAHWDGTTCDQTPPESVVSTGGVQYAPTLAGSGETLLFGGPWVYRLARNQPLEWAIADEWSSPGGYDYGCIARDFEGRSVSATQEADPEQWNVGLRMAGFGEPTFPLLGLVDVGIDGGLLFREDAERTDRWSGDGVTYAWWCIDGASGPAGPADHHAEQHGVAFVHTEDRDGEMVDLWLPIEGVDCGLAEDAGAFVQAGGSYPANYYECDGIDNDADGVVDEGMVDTDGDTVLDCGS